MKEWASLVLVVAVAACTSNGSIVTTTVTELTADTATTTTLPPVVECPGEGDFIEGGGITGIGMPGSDSDRLTRITWETSDQCETFEFRFETSEGAPATTVPPIDIEHLPSFQVVRISMGPEGTVVIDQMVETGLVERLYVVRALDGGLFVDLHLTAPAAVRAIAESSPARLLVDLRPGIVEFEGASVLGDQTVVVSHAADAVVPSEVTLSGYSRVPEASLVTVITQDGMATDEPQVVAADSQETWGEFLVETVLPQGEVSVLIGERTPVEGSLTGLTFNLIVE